MRRLSVILLLAVLLLYSCATTCPKCPECPVCPTCEKTSNPATISILKQSLNKSVYSHGDLFSITIEFRINDESYLAKFAEYQVYLVNNKTQKKELLKQGNFKINKNEFNLTIENQIPKNFPTGEYFIDIKMNLVADSDSIVSDIFTIK